MRTEALRNEGADERERSETDMFLRDCRVLVVS